MEEKEDAVRRDMRIERLRREDGRAVLLYSWPEHTDAVSPSPVANEPPLEPWSPDSGPADV